MSWAGQLCGTYRWVNTNYPPLKPAQLWNWLATLSETTWCITWGFAKVDRSHVPRGNAAGDALRSAGDVRLESCALVTRSVTRCIPTRSMGTIIYEWDSLHGELEAYRASDGSHLGSFDHLTGKQIDSRKKPQH